MKRKSVLHGLFMASWMMAGTLGAGACGGNIMTTVSGTWTTPMGAAPPAGYSAYSATLTFTGLTGVTYSLTDTVAATGTYAGCTETVQASGTYVLESNKLIVVFTSGTITRANCMNATNNVAMREMDVTDKALYTALVSGNYMVMGNTLTIGITVQGASSTTTYTKQQ